jgi:actin-like ATPase involved in cell morphogenesis
LPLSHELLGQLIAARRPTVTLALRSLEAANAVRRCDDGSWLLTSMAEAMVKAIVQPGTRAQSPDERLLVAGLLNQTQAEARALRAEADQLLADGRPSPSCAR